MAQIEVLAYSALNMNEFIDFCIRGKQTALGVFELDEEGREMRGVMSWLHGREVIAAQFFNTPPGDDSVKFFMALIEKDENEIGDRPWFGKVDTTPPAIKLDPQIAGIDRLLRMDGQIGMVDQFSPISALLENLTQNTDLEAQFDAGKERVQNVLNQIQDPTERRRFLAALRSDRGSRPTEVFAEIREKFNVSF